MSARALGPPDKRAGARWGAGAGRVEAAASSNDAFSLAHPTDKAAEPCLLCPLPRCHTGCRVLDQLHRVTGDLWHGHIPEGAVYVGRAAPGFKRTRWANPHPVGKPCKVCAGRIHSQTEAVAYFRRNLHSTPGLADAARHDLAGRDLACWCPLDQACHADVLLAAVNDGGWS